MPRTNRELLAGYAYHVLNRGNGGQEVFHKHQDYRAFLDMMTEAKQRHSLSVFAYCLMPNHFHMVLACERIARLSEWMHWYMTTHARRYHQHYETCGHVWQGRFKSFPILDDRHLLNVLRYAEGNPVRARIVRLAHTWPWSSHRETIGEQSARLIDRLPLDLPTDWPDIVNAQFPDSELSEIRCCVNRQRPYGRPPLTKKGGLAP